MLPALLVGVLLLDADHAVESGIIVDPQQRRIAGADIDVRCERDVIALKSDATGAFSLPAGADKPGCTVTVRHPGFLSRTERTDLHPVPWVIALRVAPVRDTVHVIADLPDNADRFSLASAALSAAEIRRLTDSVGDVQTYLAAAAGTTIRRTALIVDGLPSDTQPPIDTIRQVSFNVDPFSAEYGEVDRNVVEVVTAAPDRTFRFNVGAAPLAAGGANPLGSGAGSSTRGVNAVLSGGVPGAPLTFTLSAAGLRSHVERPLCAAEPEGPGAVETTVRCGSSVDTLHDAAEWQTSVGYAVDSARATLTVAGSLAHVNNSGVGGLVLPEAGVDGRQTTRELRFAAERSWTGVRVRGGLVSGLASAETSALSTDVGITILDTFTGGGASTAAARTTRTSWIAKTVLESTHRSWSSGIVVQRQRHASLERPNPFGTLLFPDSAAYAAARRGESTATWLLTHGLIDQHVGTLNAAAFAERVVVRRPDVLLRAGLRSDFQRGDGVFPGGRLFGQWHAGHWTLRGGAGTFAEPWAPDVLLLGSRTQVGQVQQFVVPNTPLFTAADPTALLVARVGTGIDSEFTRRRELRLMAAAERRIGPVLAAVEHTYTAGSRLSGSRRIPARDGWTDVLGSDRTLRRHQVHARVEAAVAGQNLTLHYEWVRSFDNTDGAMSFPERWNDIGAEWAPTTGASPHNAVVVAPLRLPMDVSLTLLATWRSSAPLTLLSGSDPDGNGLFNGRDGVPRNTGRAPGYRSVTMFASRTFRLPGFLTTASVRCVDIGVNADNVFNARNYLTIGTVRGSPSFLQPISALPGRSIRLWLKFRDQ
jgi:hypothetical protein